MTPLSAYDADTSPSEWGGLQRKGRMMRPFLLWVAGVGRRSEAAEIVRKLIDRIELSPVVRQGRKTLSVSLYGRLADILAMATKAKAPLDESDASIKVTKLVAGTRSQRYLHALRARIPMVSRPLTAATPVRIR